ncbi:protein FAN-like [Planococcus citri]|uniref:protein FAN-like n=1 Tax=Planococcus citri TaxID=170843 RepID=UPI0031F9D874
MDKERFSLLLLEPGEYYFEDYSCYLTEIEKSLFTKDETDKSIGRFRVCSKSLVFNPRDISLPLIKIPFKECTEIKRHEPHVMHETNQVISIECKQFVEMLTGNILAPYTFKHGKRKFYIKLNYVRVEDCLPHMSQLHRASSLPVAEQNQMVAAIAYDRQCRMKFDPTWLESFDDQIVIETIGSKISPLVVNPGKIVLSTQNLYFQPFNNIEPQQYIKIRISHIKSIIRRRFLLQHVGLEIYCKENSSTSHLYISLKTTKARDELYNAILKQPALNLSESDQEIMTLQWQNGTISNYDYLLYINSMADRTFNDLTQYPVFPWVIADYSSSTLDLTNPKTFRDLSKPIGALNPERLKRLKERYNEMSLPKFLYGSHYSTPGFVLFYLVRKYPHYMLCLQNGRFDHPDRMFNSVYDIWKNVLTNMSDFKELTPEFYDTTQKGDFLENKYGINFGYKHDGTRVGDVTLPPWAANPADFIEKLREALECDQVSANLHHWIDLIFGYKQNGDEAEEADNKFYYLCYEGAVDLNSVKDWNQRHALEIQIMEFGQIPKQVFKKPHPARTCSLVALEKVAPTSNDDTIKKYEFNYQWNSKEFQSNYCSTTHRSPVSSVAISKDSSTVFSVGKDALFKMHNVSTLSQERSISLTGMILSSVYLLDDGITALIGCWDSTILVYNIECGSIVDTVRGHEDAVTCIGWCNNTKRLISGSWDSMIRVWKANLPWTQLKPTSCLIAQFNHETRIPCLNVASNEKLLASGSETGDVFVWSLDTYKLKTKLTGHADLVSDLKFSHACDRLITCSKDRSFRVYDVETGSQVYFKVLDQILNCVLWDSTRVLLGGSFGTLFFWDLKKNAPIATMHAHTDSITTMHCNEDGSLVVTGGEDRRVVIWKTT